MTTNDSKPWGNPREIPADAIPQKFSTSPFEELFIDVCLRLEKTNGSSALAYPFDSTESASSASRSLGKIFSRRMGKGSVELVRGVDEEGIPTLFVRRGENWTK